MPIQDNCPKNLKQLPYRITEASCTQEIPPRKTDSLSLISEDKFLDSNEERELEELQEHPKSHITVNANADFTNESVREETEEDSESKSTNSYLDMYFETFGSFLEFGNYFFSPFITMMLENNPWKLWSSMTSFILVRLLFCICLHCFCSSSILFTQHDCTPLSNNLPFFFFLSLSKISARSKHFLMYIVTPMITGPKRCCPSDNCHLHCVVYGSLYFGFIATDL